MNFDDYRLTPERLEAHYATQREAKKARWVTHLMSSDKSIANRLEGMASEDQESFMDRMYELSSGRGRMAGPKSHYAEGNKRMMQANDKQVSGNHYKDMPIQPWAVMEAVMTPDEFIGYLKGNIIKYSLRAGRKEGSDDAGKAKHYMEKLNEMQGY